ncbi:MAG: DUF2304 domain-containing protein [Flavobacteriaceae bacterium]|nr:DUF2304 domain-containing protein [Flavobacteriaceae bacterium]
MKLTVIYIILAAITALGLALFQYIYKSKKRKLNAVFAFLRFLSIFALLVLIINPKIEQSTIYNVKPNLAIVVDNSESIQHLNQNSNAKKILHDLRTNARLQEQFDINIFTIGKELNANDSLSFKANQTNISKGFKTLDEIYKDKVAPTLLITDGNQTYGTDYEYTCKGYDNPIFPVILGDTTTYSDLKIQQLNVNKYAYLKNKFPVEIIAVYEGDEKVNTSLEIILGKQVIYHKNLQFSQDNNSETFTLTLPANRVGVTNYKAQIKALDNEKNTINNSRQFAVEVIDEKTSIALISTIVHPDIGALKKAIESNEQRAVDILSPLEFLRTTKAYQLAILYQPNVQFKETFKAIERSKLNSLIITGTQTQWAFLNAIQTHYSQELTQQTEDAQAHLNYNYNTFIIDNIDFESFPPLVSEFGTLKTNSSIEHILYQTIGNTKTKKPLVFTFEENTTRGAVILGEGIWKWRAQNYLNTESFQGFDDFIGKLVQYLASKHQKRRLTLNYDAFYSGNSNVVMIAQYFNKNYEFDTTGALHIELKDSASGNVYNFPFVLKQNNYQVDLGSLPAADYDFTVVANNGKLRRSGSFSILEYHIEQQFLNADVTKLQTIATNSGGSAFFVNNYKGLSELLLNDSRFAIVQKSQINRVPLIDFKYVLALLILTLAIEWFLRKYNGLI